jgi:7-carboxy-7-deazaguanine synthase (Cx14CxxC type)
MTYVVKEILYTLQGEGAQAGRPAVLCRFAGCNLWTGREEDRVSAVCRFCDTDFVGTDGPGGGRFASAEDLADAIGLAWSSAAVGRYVVFTGGEPTLQLDGAVLAAVHERGFLAGIETNGTRTVPDGVDWVCVSPKAGAPLLQRGGDELKVVFPQAGFDLAALEGLAFGHFFLQPCDGPELAANTRAAVDYCLAHPRWRLSLQTHKLLDIP